MAVLSLHELDDLHEELVRRVGSDDLLGVITLANRMGTLEALLGAIAMEDLVPCGGSQARRMPKVLVLGGSHANEGRLKSVIDKHTQFDSDRFEFDLEFDLRHYNFRKLRYSETYGAVIVGAMPHSTPGKGGSGSAIEEMKANPDVYPPVIEARNERGQLELNKNSFRKALEELENMYEEDTV